MDYSRLVRALIGLTARFVVKIVTVSTVSLSNEGGGPFLAGLWEVSHVFGLLLGLFSISLGDSGYLILVLFDHSAHNRLVTEV